MSVLKHKRRYRRGYPVAILVAIEENCAMLWKMFSKVVKPEKTLSLEEHRNNSKALYNFQESIINALRPTLKQGVRSVIVVSPTRTRYTEEFMDHVWKHHKYLIQGANKAVFSEMTGYASTASQVARLAKSSVFKHIISSATTQESENLSELLELHLHSPQKKSVVLFSLEEIETLILSQNKPGKPKPKYLLLTNQYLLNNHQKSRVHRVMQIAANRKVETRVVNVESPAGVRLSQLGGIVGIAQVD